MCGGCTHMCVCVCVCVQALLAMTTPCLPGQPYRPWTASRLAWRDSRSSSSAPRVTASHIDASHLSPLASVGMSSHQAEKTKRKKCRDKSGRSRVKSSLVIHIYLRQGCAFVKRWTYFYILAKLLFLSGIKKITPDHGQSDAAVFTSTWCSVVVWYYGHFPWLLTPCVRVAFVSSVLAEWC